MQENHPSISLVLLEPLPLFDSFFLKKVVTGTSSWSSAEDSELPNRGMGSVSGHQGTKIPQHLQKRQLYCVLCWYLFAQWVDFRLIYIQILCLQDMLKFSFKGSELICPSLLELGLSPSVTAQRTIFTYLCAVVFGELPPSCGSEPMGWQGPA